MIDVIVAEPNQVLRTGIRAVLEPQADFSVVGEACNAQQLYAAFLDIPHDVVVIEMGLLKRIGSAALSELRHARPASRFLVHSYEKDTDFGIEASRFGATGYVANDASASDLRAAVLNVAAGHPFVTPSLGEDLATAVCFRASNLPHARLNAQERMVFKMLAIGMNDENIAAQTGQSLEAVFLHKRRIMAKMKLPGLNELVRHAIVQSLPKSMRRSHRLPRAAELR